MKLALVVTGGLHPSGREQMMPAWLWLIERLSRTHTVHAFALQHLSKPTSYRLAGATVHDLGRPTGIWSQWKALRGALAEQGPFDLIHGFWVDPGGLLAAVAGRRLAIPSVVTCDSGEFTSLPDIGYGLQRTSRGKAVVALACRLATRVHVTTRFMALLAKAHGYDATTIPIGVDLYRVTAPAERAEGPPWRLLQVSSLNRVKDHALLLQAVALARNSIDVRLDVVGEDTLGGRLQQQAAALGLSDAVTFHGFIPHGELSQFHRAAHLYVQSSRHEAAGIATLEAAAAGVPVVGTRVGYVSDWDPHRALAVPPGDPPALAAAIVRLLQNPRERHAIAASARRFAVDHDIGWTVRALGSLYDTLVRQAG